MVCTDYNAEYDSSTDMCACPSGQTDTLYGCLSFSDANVAVGTAIKDEIVRRIGVFEAAGTWVKLGLKNRWTKTQNYWTKMNTKANLKAASTCGKKARAANNGYYDRKENCFFVQISLTFIFIEILLIESNFATYSAEDDTSVQAIVDLVKLYDSWLQNGIFNCPK